MKNNKVKSILIVLVLVIFSSGILIYADKALTPIINDNLVSGDKDALVKLFGEGENFIPVEYEDENGLIKKVYEVEGTGYAYIIENEGYADKIEFSLGIFNDGEIAGYNIIYLNDTEGFGSKVGDDEFIEYIEGKTSTSSIDTISGATMTSSAVVQGIDAARDHFNEVMGIKADGPKNPEEESEEPKKPELALGEEIKIFRDVSDDAKASIKDESEDGSIIKYTVEVPGYAVLESDYDNPEPNIVAIEIDKDGKLIKSVEILEIKDTEGIGTKVDHEDFLNQFKDLSFEDENASVDAVSAATSSSSSIVNAVLAAIEESK